MLLWDLSEWKSCTVSSFSFEPCWWFVATPVFGLMLDRCKVAVCGESSLVSTLVCSSYYVASELHEQRRLRVQHYKESCRNRWSGSWCTGKNSLWQMTSIMGSSSGRGFSCRRRLDIVNVEVNLLIVGRGSVKRLPALWTITRNSEFLIVSSHGKKETTPTVRID